MKNKGLIYTLISILTILVIALIVGMILLLNGNYNFGNKISFKNNSKVIFENTFEIKDIDLTNDYGDIKFANGSDNNIKVVVRGKNKDDVVVNDNDKLDIKVKSKKNICIGICFNNEDITIYLPKTYDKTINVKSDLGDIHVENLSNANLNIENDSGDIKIDTIKNLNVSSDLGDIHVDNINNKFVINSSTGDIKIKKINIAEDSSITLNLGDIKIEKTNNVYIDTKNDLGDVKVKDSDRFSEVTLKVQNNTGDIKINY